ncbi:MAG: N-acetylmuramoyl-L-alanine amidase, partial [Thermoleophilia bacterium]
MKSVFNIVERGKKKYLLGSAAVVVLALGAVLLYPGWRSGSTPPKTVGNDVVKTGTDFLTGQQDGTSVTAAASGKDVLALAPHAPQGNFTSERVKTDYPFNAVGLHWLAQVPAGAAVNAEIRFSQDGTTWGNWQTVSQDEADAAPDNFMSTRSAGETIGGLIFGEKDNYFQYRFDLKANLQGQAPQISRVTASYIDAMGYHQPLLSLATLENHADWLLKPVQAKGEPGVIPRSQWGADESLMTWTPEYAQPRKLIIHHTADGSNWTSDPAAAVRSIYYYHAVSLGWGDIGYNYLIDWQGNVYEGRAGGSAAPPGQSVIGGHVYGWNSGSIGIAALGTYDSGPVTAAMYNAFVWLLTIKANQFQIDPLGSDYFVHYDPFNNYAPVGSSPPNILGHRDAYPTDCPGDYLYSLIPSMRNDAHAHYVPMPPQIGNTQPSGTISNNRPYITADYSSGNGINVASVKIKLDGQDVTAGANRTGSYVSYRPPASLSAGTHSVTVTAANTAGASQSSTWSFTVAATNYTPRDYYWPWYDGISSNDWVLMANPSSAATSLDFGVAIAGRTMDLSPFSLSGAGCPGGASCGAGQVPPGRTLVSSHAGVRGGPVDAMSLQGGRGVVSQRTIWGTSSLEETPAIDGQDLSDHYVWAWYDNKSPGYTNWVMVSNPNAAAVYYEIRVAGQLKSSGAIQPGANVTPTFPGVMGGPVDVEAWTGSGKSAPANVIASQRVLMGSAFNEVAGTPASKLSDHYYWTWYDNKSPGYTNWVLVANPSSASQIYYEIRVAGQLKSSGTIQPGANVTPTFPGVMGGPVEVQAWTSSGKTQAADVIASQRVVSGPSLEEVPGYAAGSLNSSYDWTWYDNKSPGYTNWVLVANPNPIPVYYEISIGGQLKSSGAIQPGANVTPTFPGVSGGPVEVNAWTDSGKSAPANVMASQRVMLNGYFNELDGDASGSYFSNMAPTGATTNNRPIISAGLSSDDGINPSSVKIKLDGQDVTAGANRTGSYVSYRPPASLSAGTHSVTVTAANTAGASQSSTWSFTVAATNYTPRDYYWPWYDGVSSNDWVLMANPSSAATSLDFGVAIAGRTMDLSPFSLSGAGCPGGASCGAGQVPPGRTLVSNHAGVRGGPVDAMSLQGGRGVVSQRTIWGTSSLEETPAIDGQDLSDHYVWAWYDNATPGYTNWVMVSNPNAAAVYYEIRVAGQLKSSGAIQPGANVTPTFPGVMGGPVDVEAWTGSGKSAPANVIASQRVLMGSAFNEVAGTPASKLSDHYYWTWYDNKSPGYTNWVLVANPSSASQIYYEIRVAGQLKSSGTIQPGANVTPTFPGVMGGPVEVQAWTSSGKTQAADVIASQRVVSGPSLEEVPGYAAGSLNSSYDWTWYDNKSPGYTNWVLVANPNPIPVYYEISIGGQLKSSGAIQPGANVTPTFPGVSGGPVEVKAWTDSGKSAPANVMASQRVMLNGYFNELDGTVYNVRPGAVPSGPSSTVTATNTDFNVTDSSGTVLTTLHAGQTATTIYWNNGYYVYTSTGFAHYGSSYIRMTPVSSGGIMQVTSYHDVPSWNTSLDDNLFRGTLEFRYSSVSSAVWVIEEVPIELYLRGIAETSTGSPPEFLKTMSVA